MGDPWDDEDGPAEFPDDPTHVDEAEAIVKEIDASPITKPHDSKEWLLGFEAGKRGRALDVIQALIAVQLDDYASRTEAHAYAKRVVVKLEAMEKADLLRRDKTGETIGE